MFDQMARMIGTLADGRVTKIGIGVPSVVDTETGIVYNVVGIPSWKEVRLKDRLEATFGLPVRIDNDSNCFALGVTRFGIGKAGGEVVCVTLGTGVGCSLVIDGKLYAGHNTGAGEIGSVPYLDKDYEYYCSSRFFAGRNTSGKGAFDRASAGGEEALALWREFGGNMGCLMKLIMYAYDPETIVVGGKIANAYRFFEKAMREEMESFPYPKSLERLKIVPVEQDMFGLLGASLL